MSESPLNPQLNIGAVSSSLSFEEYIKKQIKEGYISENGTPLKCWCGCTDFKQVNVSWSFGMAVTVTDIPSLGLNSINFKIKIK
jgi:hypothetical protein